MRHPRRVLYIRPAVVIRILDRHHLTHSRVAAHLELSRSYWSQLVNGHRALSPEVRRRLMASRYFRGVSEDVLWGEVGDV